MMKTDTVLQPSSFTFQYGTRHTIEYLSGSRIVLPDDGATVAPAPASHPAPAVHNNDLDVSARNRQNTPEPHTQDQRLVDANIQMMTILRNYALDHANDMLHLHARRCEALLHSDARRGSPVAGPSNAIHNQNQIAPMRPPPAPGLPSNTGRARALETNELQHFSNGLRSNRHPNIAGPLQQLGGHPGTPPTSAHHNVLPAANTVAARLTAPSVGAGHDAGTAVPAGPVAGRGRAAPTGDSRISAHGRGHSAGPATSSRSQLGASCGAQTNLSGSNARAAFGSSVGSGVPVNRAARTQQDLVVTSPAESSVVASGSGQTRRDGTDTVDEKASNVANSAHDSNSVAGTQPDHTSAPVSTTANAASVPAIAAPGSAALVSDVGDSDAGPADPNSGPENHGTGTSAIPAGVAPSASVGEGDANDTKVDDQDSKNATMPATAHDTGSASNPAALAPSVDDSNSPVPVNNTAGSGSEGGHSPPHKKQKFYEGGAGDAPRESDGAGTASA